MSFQPATRPSTLAGAMEDKGGLMPYIAASTLRTVAKNPDLLTRLSLVQDTGWKAYKPLYDDADRRNDSTPASDGTNIHMVVQALHQGINVDRVPEPARSDGRAVYEFIYDHGFDILASEMFVVTQGLPELCAGTLDVLLRHRKSGRTVVGDVKSVGALTGDTRYKAMSWAIQTGVYAHGLPYTADSPPARDRWGRPLIDLSLVGEWDGFAIDTAVSLVIQVERGSAKIEPAWIDIDEGWRYAELACKVRAARKGVGESPKPVWA